MINHVVYINHDGSDVSVFNSQIIAPLKKIAEQKDISCHLVIFERFFAYLKFYRRKKIIQDLRSSNLDVIFLPRLPYVSNLLLILNSILLAVVLRLKIATRNETLVFHSRGALSAYIGIWTKRLLGLNSTKVIYDCRGDALAEFKFYNQSNFLFKKLRAWQLIKLESAVLRNVDRVLVVSNQLKMLLNSKYGYKGTVDVLPSAIDIKMTDNIEQTRKIKREELGIENSLVVIYSGSLLPWQMPGKLIQIFSVFKQVDPNSYFFMLTMDEAKAQLEFKNAQLPEDSYRIINVRYEDLPSYLMCGDVGLLLREKNSVNRVASPTKLVEYLSAGIPVLLSAGIGDSEDLMSNDSYGWVIDSIDDEKEIFEKTKKIVEDIKSGKIDHKKIVQMAKKQFSLETNINKVIQIYN